MDETIFSHNGFHLISLQESFDSDLENAPVAGRLASERVLSGPLPSTSGVYSTCFKAVTCDKKLDTELYD